MDIKVGDYVTRISHKHDMIFRVIDIDDGICYLKGANVRLYADSDMEDLIKTDFKMSDDKEVVIKGWYRRSTVPYVELYSMEVDGKIKKCHTYTFARGFYVILMLLSILCIILSV